MIMSNTYFEINLEKERRLNELKTLYTVDELVNHCYDEEQEVEQLNNIIDKTINRCNYLLNNDKIIINNKEYIKQPADDYITQYIKEALNGGDEE